MHPPGAETVLVRYGEIGVKSARVQSRMEGQLADNIRATLDARGHEYSLDREHTRLYVHTTAEQVGAVTDAVTDVFGVVSASPVCATEPTLDRICAVLESAAQNHDEGSFAVRARRAGSASAHPFSSGDIERAGGDAVWQTLESRGIEPAVDLERPARRYYVECRPDRAFVFLEKRDGPGGLPLGTQQPLVALVSGGIDSPVAAWLAMKRGCPVVPLYIDLGDYGGPDHRARAIETLSRLERYAAGHGLPMHVAQAGEAIDRIVTATESCRMPVLRRFMYRVAERVAEEHDAVGIVTGEAIGQKSSQTSATLRAASAATTLPVHRPLLTMDKSEISGRARDIGTYDDSTIHAGCYRLAPDNPATRPSIAAVRQAEPPDMDTIVEQTAGEVTVVETSTQSG